MKNSLNPPKKIFYSLYSYLLTIPLVIVYLMIVTLKYRTKIQVFDINANLLDFAISFLLILLILRKKNWARIIYTIITSFAVLGTIYIIINTKFVNIDLTLLIFFQIILRSISVYFLYVKESQEWFKPSYAKKTDICQSKNESTFGPESKGQNNIQNITNISNSEALNSVTGTSQINRLWHVGKNNKNLLLFSILIICLISVYVGNRELKKASINNVFIADKALAQKIFANNSMTDSDTNTLYVYTQSLRQIDMSRCPRDFQLAYLDHIQAWESLERSRSSIDLVKMLIEFLIFKKIPDITDESDAKPINDEIINTWNKIERIALSYGVKFHE